MTLKFSRIFIPVLCMMAAAIPAMADQPVEWGIHLQDAASPAAERIHEFHDMMLWIISAITIFVLGLLIYVVVRFNARVNKTPAMFTHNLPLEIIWTVIPVVILIIVALPSIKLLYYVDRTAEPDMTLKVSGYQWYWGYEYPDHQGISFSSYMVPDKEIDATKGQVRLLSTDNPVVLPIDKNIQILVTSDIAGVIHAWTVPALGSKVDAVPGRTNETWFRINKPGTYYGQCSELCGKDHAYMPIEIKAVTQEEFDAWVLEKAGPAPATAEPAEGEGETPAPSSAPEGQ